MAPLRRRQSYRDKNQVEIRIQHNHPELLKQLKSETGIRALVDAFTLYLSAKMSVQPQNVHNLLSYFETKFLIFFLFSIPGIYVYKLHLKRWRGCC